MNESTDIQSTVRYRMPGESDFHCLNSKIPFQPIDSIEEGFIFSNFDSNKKYRLENFESIKNEWTSFTPYYLPANIPSKISTYLNSVNHIINQIKERKFKKLVFSRIKVEEKKSSFNLENTFNQLCSNHPNAFVYCISSKETGTWIGASPELLISKKEEQYKTKSLAGTRTASSLWTSKEKQEQELVTQYITSTLSNFVSEITISEPYDSQAGEVFHLKSDINFKLKASHQISLLIDKLHPTPAVCGIPTENAKTEISKLELHQRELYTGFIGPFGIDNHSSLFVNLRCMQIHHNTVSIYVGGGIMGDSNANNEWEETENKAKTMLSVL